MEHRHGILCLMFSLSGKEFLKLVVLFFGLIQSVPWRTNSFSFGCPLPVYECPVRHFLFPYWPIKTVASPLRYLGCLACWVTCLYNFCSVVITSVQTFYHQRPDITQTDVPTQHTAHQAWGKGIWMPMRVYKYVVLDGQLGCQRQNFLLLCSVRDWLHQFTVKNTYQIPWFVLTKPFWDGNWVDYSRPGRVW